MGLLQWRSVGVLNHDPRATKTELRKGAVNRKSKEIRGIAETSVDVEATGELRWERTGRKKGKNSQRKYGKQHRTGNGENTTEIQDYPEEVHERRERTRDGTNLRRVCGKMKMKKTGRKKGETKQNGNTLRTRAGNRGGLVPKRKN